ncbi:MAG: sulfurtransferase [Pseudomonadales bacterium]
MIKSRPFITSSEVPTSARFIDCRFELQSKDDTAGHTAFLAGHIPGAVYAHLNDDLSGPIMTNRAGRHPMGRHPLPPVSTWWATLSNWGINTDDVIVCYDDHNAAFAARACWMLRQSGYQAYVLNGGFAAWRAAGGAIATEAVDYATSDIPQPQPFKAVSFKQLDSAGKLIDARASERYLGKTEPLDPIAGHIPDAMNLPFADNFDKGYLKSEEQLGLMWEPIISKHKQRTHYCGSGVTACVNLLVLAQLGYGDDSLYAGSWSDWCSHQPLHYEA